MDMTKEDSTENFSEWLNSKYNKKVAISNKKGEISNLTSDINGFKNKISDKELEIKSLEKELYFLKAAPISFFIEKRMFEKKVLEKKEFEDATPSKLFEDARLFFNKCILDDKDMHDKDVYIDMIELVKKAYAEGRLSVLPR